MTTPTLRSMILGLAVAAPALAAADPAPEPTAAGVADAPVPGKESGRVDDGDGGDSAVRLVARGVLFIPRFAFEVGMAPIRGGVWVNSEYRVYDRLHAFFFDETETYGLYPTMRLQSGFGFTAGARFVHRDAFGHREHLSLFAGTGGRYRMIATAGLRSGALFGDRFSVELDGEVDRRPEERFLGIGNADGAMETRYRQELERTSLVADVRVAGDLHLRPAVAHTQLAFDRSDTGPPIDEVYMPDELVGWDGVRHVYGELEVRWDDRGQRSRWEPQAIPAGGSVAGIYAGRVHRLDAGGADYWRYGVDLQHFLRLSAGPRLLILRAHGEAVGGDYADVPFAELPALGGTRYLRGYPTERFRDRLATVASAEYQFDLLRTLSASVFVDAGRVHPSLADLTTDDLRVGYGGVIQFYSERSLWIRATIASSIDGGLELSVSFDPVTELDGRVERR